MNSTRIDSTIKRIRFPSLRFGLALIALSTCILVGCDKSTAKQTPAVSEVALSPESEAKIRSFCGDCHPMPVPESFPKTAWHDEVKRGFEFYYSSGRSDLVVPTQSDTQTYFVTRAPEVLPLSQPLPVDKSWQGRFDLTEITPPDVNDSTVSFVSIVSLFDNQRGILFSDMRNGGVHFAPLSEAGEVSPPVLLGRVANPAAVRVVDWDQDGRRDLLVSDLGSFLPQDHQLGKVVWLKQTNLQTFEAITLHEGIGRVASVEVADFNGDSKQDILVAEFGWQKTGSIFWLERTSEHDAIGSLVKHPIDPRSGTIHIPIIDVNQDGAPDFVALISQHHERIEAMINDGKGHFRSELIYAAPEPSFGSSGLQLTDWNDDGRVDVLYTNGDSFDSFVLKPSHGVRWFENRGTYPFHEHLVGKLPGAHRALTCDLDGDGQMEIIAGAFLPRSLLKAQSLREAEGLVLWKHSPTGYEKSVLSNSQYNHAAMTVSDLNGDKRDDLVLGHFRDGGTGPALTVWMSKPLATK
jgi:hypothetical protein